MTNKDSSEQLILIPLREGLAKSAILVGAQTVDSHVGPFSVSAGQHRVNNQIESTSSAQSRWDVDYLCLTPRIFRKFLGLSNRETMIQHMWADVVETKGWLTQSDLTLSAKGPTLKSSNLIRCSKLVDFDAARVSSK